VESVHDQNDRLGLPQGGADDNMEVAGKMCAANCSTWGTGRDTVNYLLNKSAPKKGDGFHCRGLPSKF